MAEQKISLFDLLNLSISSPGQGAVNFRAMYTLLNCILKHLDIRDVTVGWTETVPCDSSPEPQKESEEEHGQSHKEQSAAQKGQPGSEAPQGTAPGGQGTPREDDFTEETGGELRQALELLQRLQKQTDRLQDSVKELRLQQEKATGVQSQWVKALEDYNFRVEALEESMRLSETDELSRYVTWEAMKSALTSEREIVQKELIQTKDTKEIHSTQSEQDRSDAHTSPVKTQTTADSSTETTERTENVPLSQRVCGSQMYPETVEALKNIGRLKQRCDSLEARISALNEKKRQEQSEITQLRELLQNRASQDVFEAVREELDEQKALVQSFHSEQEKSVHLVSSVQKAIVHLQAECERLHETTRCLHEDNQQKQTHIEELYKTTEELEEKKADKNMVETEIQADKSALESKVSRVQFDSVTEQLSSMFNELMSKVTDQEQDWNKLMDKLSAEMDCKLNRIELDSVKKQLEARWKSIQAQMQNQGGFEQDDAAGIRKQLVERFHCLSCDRPVKHSPGPQLLTLPSSPGLQPHRSMRPFTVYTLEQIRQHYRSERILEVADYSLYSVSRSCGGSHTVKSHTQRRSGLQQNKLPSQLDEGIGQSEEVDIVGLDGHIYKGRLNASPGRNTDTKLPTIATKDGSSKSRDKMRSSTSHRVSPEGPTTPLHPPSVKSPSCRSASCSSGRDWPVSALGCTSQSSIVPMSVNAPGSSTDTLPEQAF